MPRKIGLAALTVLELSPPEMVSCARDAGYDAIGLRLLPATPTEVQHAIVGDTPLARETERRIADTGLPVLDIEIFRLKPDTKVADYRAALETGARFGAREALIAGNDPDEARLTASFAAFCDLAAEYGIAANLEPMPWTDVKTFEQGARIVAAAGRGNAGVLMDAIHFDRAGDVPASIAAAPVSRLRYMQLCDAPATRPTDLETLLLPGARRAADAGRWRARSARHVARCSARRAAVARDPDAGADTNASGSAAHAADAGKDAAAAGHPVTRNRIPAGTSVR